MGQKTSKTRAPAPKATTAKKRQRKAFPDPRAISGSSVKSAQTPLVFARTIDDLDHHTAKWRNASTKIALVPTMGALHDGHMALIAKARKIADRTIVSLYVNPTQFAANEDLDTYPRDERADAKALHSAGVDLVWAPSNDIMFPNGFATNVVPNGAATGLESDNRPHFFQGVATVVLKLFNQVGPDIALFGEKDYQQLCVIRQMEKDFDLCIEIHGVGTVREPDGLALSSRNAYLTPQQRAIAPVLNATLREFAQTLTQRENTPSLRASTKMKLLVAGFDRVDYIEAREADTLNPYNPASGRPGRVLAAAWLKSTRLIDNVPIPPGTT